MDGRRRRILVAVEPVVLEGAYASLLERVGLDDVVAFHDAERPPHGDDSNDAEDSYDAAIVTIELPDAIRSDLVIVLPDTEGASAHLGRLTVGGRAEDVDASHPDEVLDLLDAELPASAPRALRLHQLLARPSVEEEEVATSGTPPAGQGCDAVVMPDPLLKKLQHREGTQVLVLGAPDELEPVLARWAGTGVAVGRAPAPAAFVLGFVRSRDELDEAGRWAALVGGPDAILWLAYPKKSSKRYRSDLSRDDAWQPLADLGFEPVRQVAIDDDWSALRFRHTEHIKTMTRSRALSDAGRERLARASEAAPQTGTDAEAP